MIRSISGSWWSGGTIEGRAKIYGRIINADGILLPEDFLIADNSSCSLRNPQVAFDPTSQRFLVVWNRYCGGVELAVQGRILLADGWEPHPDFDVAVEAGEEPEQPEIAYDSDEKKFLVIWRKESSKEIQGKILDAFGTVLKPSFPIASGGSPLIGVAFNSTNARHLVVWGTDLGASNNILGQFLNSGGEPQGSAILIADQSSSLRFPAVAAYNPACSGFMVAYEIEEAVYQLGQNFVEGSTCAHIYLPLILRP